MIKVTFLADWFSARGLLKYNLGNLGEKPN